MLNLHKGQRIASRVSFRKRARALGSSAKKTAASRSLGRWRVGKPAEQALRLFTCSPSYGPGSRTSVPVSPLLVLGDLEAGRLCSGTGSLIANSVSSQKIRKQGLHIAANAHILAVMVAGRKQRVQQEDSVGLAFTGQILRHCNSLMDLGLKVPCRVKGCGQCYW